MSDKAKVECLESVLEHAKGMDEVPMVVICQGRPPRCDYDGSGPPRDDCPYCARVRADDPRDPDDIIADMQKLSS